MYYHDTAVTGRALRPCNAMASAHFLFTSIVADHDSVLEFATRSEILTAEKVTAPEGVSSQGKLFVDIYGLPHDWP